MKRHVLCGKRFGSCTKNYTPSLLEHNHGSGVHHLIGIRNMVSQRGQRKVSFSAPWLDACFFVCSAVVLSFDGFSFSACIGSVSWAADHPPQRGAVEGGRLHCPQKAEGHG